MNLLTADAALFRSLDLSYNTQLRIIHFNLGKSDHTHTEWVAGILSQIVSYMDAVVFTLFLHNSEEPDLIDWGQLEMIFAQPHFSRLRIVQFCYVGRLRLEDISAWLIKRLPECHIRGILRFADEPWDRDL
jgi:hypothetical protein